MNTTIELSHSFVEVVGSRLCHEAEDADDTTVDTTPDLDWDRAWALGDSWFNSCSDRITLKSRDDAEWLLFAVREELLVLNAAGKADLVERARLNWESRNGRPAHECMLADLRSAERTVEHLLESESAQEAS